MKRLLACLLLAAPLAFAAPPKAKRSARSASLGADSAPAAPAKKTAAPAKSAAKASPSGKSSSGKKSARSDASKEDGEAAEKSNLSAPAECMLSASGSVMEGECAYLLEGLPDGFKSKDFLCVYQTKGTAKSGSATEIYMQQNYGLSESGLKANTAEVGVKYKKRGLRKYYDYIVKRADSGSLSEADILSPFATELLDKSNLDYDSIETIEEKDISSVSLAADITKTDMDACLKRVKETTKECGYSNDNELKKRIETSCAEYESELMKLAATARAEAVKRQEKIISALLDRVSSVVANERRAIDLAKEQANIASDRKDLNEKTAQDANNDKNKKECEKKDRQYWNSDDNECVPCSDLEILNAGKNGCIGAFDGCPTDRMMTEGEAKACLSGKNIDWGTATPVESSASEDGAADNASSATLLPGLYRFDAAWDEGTKRSAIVIITKTAGAKVGRMNKAKWCLEGQNKNDSDTGVFVDLNSAAYNNSYSIGIVADSDGDCPAKVPTQKIDTPKVTEDKITTKKATIYKGKITR